MKMTQPMVIHILRRVAERKPCISDYRKGSDGKVRRFIDWRRV